VEWDEATQTVTMDLRRKKLTRVEVVKKINTGRLFLWRVGMN